MSLQPVPARTRQHGTATAEAPTMEPVSAAATRIGDHLGELLPVLAALRTRIPVLTEWGRTIADILLQGGRVLAAGNGGSAAEAQHLTAELVGRFESDRRPFSAIALHADTSSLTAIGNDYGYDHVYARQVHAHARPGDVVVLLSTSGRSANLLRAAEAAKVVGARAWALTGTGPNPLCRACDEHIALPGPAQNVQEAQLVAVHALCLAVEAALAERGAL